MKPKAFSATKTKMDRRNSSTRNIAHEGACSECTTNCQLVHRNQADPLSSVSRFFKIMLGKDFSELMFVPSSVAREHKWRKHINKEACLENTLGQKYPVKISEVDNAIAFKEGWCRFSTEHHLKEGDFVVFNHVRYAGKLHFIVHIYGKSGGEKVFFQRGHDKNVYTMDKNAVLLTEALEAEVMISDSKRSPSPSVVPEPLYTEGHVSTTPNNTLGEYTNGKLLQIDHASWDMEPLCMLDRDAQNIDDRTCPYDLSSFEKQDRPAAAKVSISNVESDTMSRAEKIVDSQTDSDLLNTLPVKRKFSSAEPEPQPNKKQAPVNVAPAMKMSVNGGERYSTHVPKMIERRDRYGLADNIPVQTDVPISKTPSLNSNLDIKKKIDMSGPVSSAKDIRQKVSTCVTIEPATVNGAPEMKVAVNNGERSSTHVEKTIKCRDRSGPADKIPVLIDVPILKPPSYMAKLNNKKSIDMSGPTISAQVAPGGPIKTVKKELDTGDELFHNLQCLSVKKKTIIPDNVRRSSLNGKKEVKIPKTEPLCLENISTSSVLREFSTGVVDDKPYLILQSPLSSVLLPREKLRTIYLRAPDRKVFPVTYQQKNSVRILASGWQLFKSVYHLHAGDRCHIELEDESKRIYKFEVLSRGTILNSK